MRTIDFYFDFSSPYGYIAAMKIDAFAAKHGREVAWHPILLGAIFKVTGGRPLTELPFRGEYHKRDFARSAAFHGVPYRFPSVFPISSVAPARACCWLAERDPARAAELAKRLYRAFFVDDVDVSTPDNVVRIAAGLGEREDAVRAALDDPAVKALLRRDVDTAIARGVFGSPFLIVDGEPFWGVDRFDQIERWLAAGGW